MSEVPQSMIDYQLDRTVAEYGLAAQSYGMTLEQALSSVGVSTKEELGKKYADDLKEQARQGLVMQAVAEDAAIDVLSLIHISLVVEELFKTIRQLNATGMSILLIEQNARQALRIADRAYVLESGKITMEGTGEELLNNEKVKEAYLGL